MTSLLERSRALHEDIELFERAIVKVMTEDVKTHKDNIIQAHAVKEFVDKIIDRNNKLVTIYEDKTGELKEEVTTMGGAGPNLFSLFYEKLRELKDYHRKFPYLNVERPEAEQMINALGDEPPVPFTGEESYGRYLDLHPLFEKYINLTNVKKLEYIKYLDIFYKFSDRSIVRDTLYRDYLKDLSNYLVDFFKRSQPLFDLDEPLQQFEKDFEDLWTSGKFKPLGSDLVDGSEAPTKEKENYCKYCNRQFAKDSVFKGHLNGKKHKKAKEKAYQLDKEINRLENKVNRMADLLVEQIQATKDHIETKQSRTTEEIVAEIEDEGSLEEEPEEEEVRMTKENYPIGWDGNPIPYWLYKLHGLGNEYKCEICGNTSYWGRRAFEKHFQEWRHAHGMKCLRLENTKDFHEITRIQDALDLDKRLKQLKTEGVWDSEKMEEYEDAEGTVMTKKMYLDLQRQGLI
eukprot:TRINITY_DN8401_c0_g1_i1.p1 TRINITY_DN8401_c0_g1~~TRINITY_DN8401_c0_g1_i1.p1  ORF type:complete len:477 (-),score=93.97 TRINITY_DN8401_c0_g1_i1:58-1434(-)